MTDNDFNDVLYTYEQILKMGDALDRTGIGGVPLITDGKYTTREMTRVELGFWLIHIANSDGFFVDDEVKLINLVLGENYSANQLRQIVNSVDEPDSQASLTLVGYLQCDKALTRQNGYKTTSSTDTLIQAFEAFGNLMASIDGSYTAKVRCADFIAGMKSFVIEILNEYY